MRSAARYSVFAMTALLVALSGGVASAQAAPPELFYASENREGKKRDSYPPGSGLEGPCGVAVDGGKFYVSDYYHDVVDVFESSLEYAYQIKRVEPYEGGKQFIDGPCGLAVGQEKALYVNIYHRSVVRFAPFGADISGPGTMIDSNHPTGVAVNPATNNVYVNGRTQVSVYEPSGAVVEEGGEALSIGQGNLEDGYGVAVSGFAGAAGQPSTAGLVYVPDAGDNTVKIFDPAVDPDEPVAVIDGHETPAGGFVSLRDAAIAIDQVTGVVYVADDLQPEFYERPEAAVYAFNASGAFAGRLQYNVVNARPVGLAVGQNRVYVTSGNSEDAHLDIYSTGELTAAAFPPLGAGFTTLAAATPPAFTAAPAAALPPSLAPPAPIAAEPTTGSPPPRRSSRRRHQAKRHPRARHVQAKEQRR
jgi:DNA-binding beta-propeller fold protein YncE